MVLHSRLATNARGREQPDVTSRTYGTYFSLRMRGDGPFMHAKK